MAIHKTGTSNGLRTFVSGGKILLVRDIGGDTVSNLGAVFDVDSNSKGIAWASSGMSEVQGDLVREIRVVEGEDYRYYEVELDSKADLVLVFRSPLGPEEEAEIKRWRKDRDEAAIKAQLPETLEMVDGLESPGQPKEKYYFSYWTEFIPGIGLYPVGVVVASGARLAFLGLEGNEAQADAWQRNHANDVTGNPRKDLENLSLGGVQTSFSQPQPLAAYDFMDAVQRALDMAHRSKKQIDVAAAQTVVV